MAAPLRFGILGAARIARKFVEGIAGSRTVQVTAVASRDHARARAFAQALDVQRVSDSYEELIGSDDIDAIYNPLPNGLHAEWSIRAMDAGKHVLCEKPLALSRAEAERMYAAAHRNGVKLAEAFPYRSQPQTLELQRMINAGVIGQVRMIWATFAFTLASSTDIRMDPKLGGGALMDLGSYPLSLIRMIAGEVPASLHAVGVMDPSGVDTTAQTTLGFTNGIFAQASCSFSAAIHRQAPIAGDDGVIETNFANHTSADSPARLILRRGRENRPPFEVIELEAVNGFRAEAEAFASYVDGHPWTGISEEESIDVAGMLETLRGLVASGAVVQ